PRWIGPDGLMPDAHTIGPSTPRRSASAITSSANRATQSPSVAGIAAPPAASVAVSRASVAGTMPAILPDAGPRAWRAAPMRTTGDRPTGGRAGDSERPPHGRGYPAPSERRDWRAREERGRPDGPASLRRRRVRHVHVHRRGRRP